MCISISQCYLFSVVVSLIRAANSKNPEAINTFKKGKALTKREKRHTDIHNSSYILMSCRLQLWFGPRVELVQQNHRYQVYSFFRFNLKLSIPSELYLDICSAAQSVTYFTVHVYSPCNSMFKAFCMSPWC